MPVSTPSSAQYQKMTETPIPRLIITLPFILRFLRELKQMEETAEVQT